MTHRCRSRAGAPLRAAVFVCVFAAAAGPASAELARLVDVEVRNLSGRALKDVPVTFGHVFRKGELARPFPVRQLDVKRRYEDGSVRFAVISMILPELPAGSSKVVTLFAGRPAPPPEPACASPGDLLKTDFDAVVTLAFPDGAVRTASARKLLEAAGPKARRWLSGPLATEWLVDGPLTGADGNADPDLHVRFQVRAYAGCKRVRVSVAVENCWDTWAGNIGYDVSISVGGRVVYSRKGVAHRPLSRWRKVFWWGGEAPPVHVVHNLGYLCSTGALPNYDRTIKIPEQALAKMAARWAKADTDIMGSGSLTKYMPTTGGRGEIGPYPTWTAQYLLSMDPRAKRVVLGNGDLAGSWPIHVRARKTGRVMTLDERPRFWLDARGKDKPAWQPHRQKPPERRSPAGRAYYLTPDRAHQGSLAYVPYLVTGDYYYLEEAYFWANYCLLSMWPHIRQDARGILKGQIRGNAWGLRNIADAAFIACDGDREAKYFDEKIRNNIACLIEKMYGPPEYNAMGFWGLRTVSNARIQNAANPSWMVIAPWEHDYLMWSLHHLTELGYAGAARPRDFLLRWRVGAFTHVPDFDPQMGAPYRFVVGEIDANKKVTFYEDWKRLGRENARLYKPGLPGYGGSYSYSARLAVVAGVDGGFPKAEQALKYLDTTLPVPREAMTRNPAWAIVPRRRPGGR